mgnify:CR=1 FL=1
MTPGAVEVDVFTVEKTVSLTVCVLPLRDTVETDVPWRSTRIVEVDWARVVVFEMSFVVEMVVENVWPGKMLVFKMYEVIVSVWVDFNAALVVVVDALTSIRNVLVD